VNKRSATASKVLTYLLIFSFIGWANASAFQSFAQGQTPAAQAKKTIAANGDLQAVDTGNGETDTHAMKTQAVEKAESEKPHVKKKHFHWFGVILGLAIVGGLVYYLFILKHNLQVNTTPAGARIYLDGKDSGNISPCLLKPSLGAHTIKAVLDGYADLEQEVVVKNGKNSVELILDIGTFDISAPAANANVQRETTCLISWDSSAQAARVPAPAAGKAQGVPLVDLELFQSGVKVSDIAHGVQNSGSYTWNVPAATKEGHNCKILVSCPGVPEARAFGPAFNLLGFKEDFADNKADFWLPDNASSWNAAGGYYTAVKTTENLATAIYDSFYGESSYTVESRMRWSEHSGGNGGAPLFIMLGNTNSFTSNSGYVLGYSMDGMVSIYKIEYCNLLDPPPFEPAILYSGSSSAVNQGLNAWNTVRVVRNESRYALYINSILVYTLIDSTYNPTHVMIGFGGAGEKTTCDFDYVYVTVDPESHSG
jgi:hypothetical protein